MHDSNMRDWLMSLVMNIEEASHSEGDTLDGIQTPLIYIQWMITSPMIVE